MMQWIEQDKLKASFYKNFRCYLSKKRSTERKIIQRGTLRYWFTIKVLSTRNSTREDLIIGPVVMSCLLRHIRFFHEYSVTKFLNGIWPVSERVQPFVPPVSELHFLDRSCVEQGTRVKRIPRHSLAWLQAYLRPREIVGGSISWRTDQQSDWERHA